MHRIRSIFAVSKNISVSHFWASNEEIQLDFVFTDIRETNYFVLHMTDAETLYLETAIVSMQSPDYIISALEAS